MICVLHAAVGATPANPLSAQAEPGDTQLRDGLIQRFQRFQRTYALSHKMLKRHLEQAAANPQAYDTADFST